MTIAGVPSRSWRAAFAAALLSAATAPVSACTGQSYAGIPLAAGAAEAELQDLAQRASAGDQHAQLELGIRYEEGRGVPVDLERAVQLYRRAAARGSEPRMAYVPGTNGRPGTWTILSSGGHARPGLPEASLRLLALVPGEGLLRTDATVVDGGVSEPLVCERLEASLRLLYGAAPSECAAYPFEVRPRGGRAFVAYDLVVSIPPEAAAEREYATNGVDPVVMALIDREAPVAGALTYSLFPATAGPIAVIFNFEPQR